MIKYGQIPFYLILVLIIIGVSFLIGTNIVNVVDRRLSDISINMPNITLPTPNFTVHMNKDGKTANMSGGFSAQHYDINANNQSNINTNTKTTATYYKDPNQLTDTQRKKFKEHAKFSRMTIQDYMNWLSMFKDDIYELSKKYPKCVQHYNKYLEGTITEEDLSEIQSIARSNLSYKIKPYSIDMPNHTL